MAAMTFSSAPVRPARVPKMAWVEVHPPTASLDVILGANLQFK